jgi:hypothetical protein
MIMNTTEREELAGDDLGMLKELSDGEKKRDFECRSPSTTEDTIEEEDGEAETSINAVPPQATHADVIPDGGLIAWLQVLGSFFLFINCWYVALLFLLRSSFAKDTITGESSMHSELFNISTKPISSLRLPLLTYLGSAPHKLSYYYSLVQQLDPSSMPDTSGNSSAQGLSSLSSAR